VKNFARLFVVAFTIFTASHLARGTQPISSSLGDRVLDAAPGNCPPPQVSCLLSSSGDNPLR